eukprot:9491830-Pyramimonas_sp.AAC.1
MSFDPATPTTMHFAAHPATTATTTPTRTRACSTTVCQEKQARQSLNNKNYGYIIDDRPTRADI